MPINPATAIIFADSSAALGWVYLGIFVAAYVAYLGFLRSGMRPRTVVTSLSETQITEVFVAKVAGMGWHTTDWCWDNPDGRLVAESSLLSGIRQQIGLTISTDPRHPGKLVAKVMVKRYSKKLFGGPTKAHTLRMRLSGFASGIKRLDPGAQVTVGVAAAIPSNKPVVPAFAAAMPTPAHVVTPVGAPAALSAPAASSVGAATSPASWGMATPIPAGVWPAKATAMPSPVAVASPYPTPTYGTPATPTFKGSLSGRLASVAR